MNIFRIDDPRLAKNEFENDIELSPNEVLFWNDLLKKYLHPIDANKQREVIIFFYFLSSSCKCTYNVSLIFQ